MDPNATHTQIMILVASLIERIDAFDEDTVPEHLLPLVGDASDLADAIVNLDGWLKKGGFLPEAWTR